MLLPSIKSRRLRVLLRDGVMALAPVKIVLLFGAIGGALLLVPVFPMWFLGRCVFVNHYRNFEGMEAACSPFPEMSVDQWLALVVGLVAIGLVHSLVHRYAVRDRWERRVSNTVIHAADLYALLMGLLLAIGWSRHVPLSTGVSFAGIVIMTAPVVGVLVWRGFTAACAHFYARMAPSDTTIAATVHILLMRHFALTSITDLQVRCAGTTVHVTGPFDAVDAKRIDDLLAREYPMQLTVSLESTLSEDAYWRAYREDLTRNNHTPTPLKVYSIPSVLVYGVAALGIAVVAMAILQGAGTFLGASEFRQFLGMQAGRVPDVDPVASDLIEATDEYPPLRIDVEASFDACPTLNRNALRRWRMRTETLVLNNDRATVARIHSLDLKFYLFLISRGTRACFMELEFDHLDAAKSASRRYTTGSGWEEIPLGYDWTHVPPIAY